MEQNIRKSSGLHLPSILILFLIFNIGILNLVYIFTYFAKSSFFRSSSFFLFISYVSDVWQELVLLFDGELFKICGEIELLVVFLDGDKSKPGTLSNNGDHIIFDAGDGGTEFISTS